MLRSSLSLVICTGALPWLRKLWNVFSLESVRLGAFAIVLLSFDDGLREPIWCLCCVSRRVVKKFDAFCVR